MKFWKKDSVDLEKLYALAQKGYAINNPEKIQGYNGYLSISFGDIYVDEYVYEKLQSESAFEEVVNACMQQFRDLDYGRKVTRYESDLNFENRLYCGLNWGLVGRYETRYGTLEIRIPEELKTEITLCSYGIDEIRESTKKRLFSANVVCDLGEEGSAYRLEPVGEKVMGEIWNMDLEELFRQKHKNDKHPEDITFHKSYPYNTPLDRNGLSGDEELFVEFNDGDLWGMSFYYTKEEK